MKPLLVKEILSSANPLQDISARGWVRTVRESKGFCFIELNDGSHQNNLQIIIPDSISNYNDLQTIPVGSSIWVNGDLVESPAAGQKFELKAVEAGIYGTADPESYPLQKKRHSFEFLRDIAHLRGRTASFGAVFRLRSELAFAVHNFFRERSFHYVHTPIITASDCEGAGEMFTVTTLDPRNVPLIDGKTDYSRDFFGKHVSLTVSGQLEGELLATSLGRIYTFGPTFRAENSNTSRHLSEFWMIEPEMSFAELDDDRELAESFLKYIFQHCLDNCSNEMSFFDKRISPGVIERLEKIITSAFMHITYTEAVDILAKSGESFDYPVKWGTDLQSEHERFLTEKKFGMPVIVTDYPKEIKSFYMRLNDDGKTVRAMDVLVPGVGEIIGGSEREYRLNVIEQRMRESGLAIEDYSWYLDTRRFGSVPHAGFGLGFERAVQFISGMQNIRDVIPFPRFPRHAKF